MLAACGSSNVGPATASNQALIDRFTPILAHADSIGEVQRASALVNIISLLQLGSPTNSVILNIEGRALRFTAVSGLVATVDSTDSVFIVSAWRDANADTTVQSLLFNDQSFVASGAATRRSAVPPARLRVHDAARGARADNGLGAYAEIEYVIDDSFWLAATPNIEVGLQLVQLGGACDSIGGPNVANFTPVSCVQMRSLASFSGTLTDEFEDNPRRVALGATMLSGIAVQVRRAP
jgi:hypothetical protein